jgi:hypothetical protein
VRWAGGRYGGCCSGLSGWVFRGSVGYGFFCVFHGIMYCGW